MNTHFLRYEIGFRRRSLAQTFAPTEEVDRDCCLMAMGHGPDNVLWSKC